jgi:gliding-associated putative ABC transporter substrate-binding component GldG
MAKPEVKTKSTASLLIIIIAAILIIINLISLNLFSRADLTEGNIYSLSDASKALIGKLNDRLTVKAFITEDLPAPHNGDARYLKDLLDDYRAYSHGYLQYEFIDPAKTDREEEAMGYRIPPLQFNVFRNDKTEFIKGYKGVALLYGDNQEVIPFIENTSNLEYDLSRAMNKLSQTTVPSIAFTTGHGEPDMSTGLNWANQLLQKEYRVQFLNLANLKSIPEQTQALFIASPKEKFNDWEIYLIDQFIMRGGRLACLIDKFDIDIRQSLVLPVDYGLDSLLRFYGVGIDDKLVVDLQCNMVPVMRDMGQFRMQSIVNYPYYPALSNFNKENPIVKTLKSFGLLFVSPLDFSPEPGENLERQWLFTSSEHSGARSIPVDISPEKKYSREDFNLQNLPLAASLSGHLESYFNDKELPEYSGTDTISSDIIPGKIDFTDDARIVVVGNGSFIRDDNRGNNTAFVILLNIADWLTQEKGLISIRSKQVTARMLGVTSDGTKRIVKYLNMFAMPALVVLFGIARWQFKRSVRKREAA